MSGYCVCKDAISSLISWRFVCLSAGQTLRTTGSCCACGLLAFGLEKICLPHLGAMVTVLLELVITGAVYWFLLLMLRSFRGQDLNYVPGGKVLRAFGKTLRLL